MTELDILLVGFRILHKVEQHNSFALTEVHLVYLYWWKHALKHQAHDLVGVCLLTTSEPIHNQQGWRLQSVRKDLGILFDFLLVRNHIFAERIFKYLHRDGWSFGIFEKSDIV